MALNQVRCRTCRRLLGVGPTAFRIYCDEICAHDLPVSTSEDRDDLLNMLNRHVGISKAELARVFGFTRQRADQIVAARSYLL